MKTGKWKYIISTAVLLLVMAASLLAPVSCTAATQYTFRKDSAENVIRIYRDGVLTNTISGGWQELQGAVMDGGTIYFALGDYEHGYDLWSCKVKTGEEKYLCGLPKNGEYYNLNEKYSGNIYITNEVVDGDDTCYRYNLKSKKLKKIADGGYSSRYKNTIICTNGPEGDWGSFYSISVYNTKTGKGKKLETRSGGYTVSGGVIYYSSCKNKKQNNLWSNPKAQYSVKAYNMKTGKTKTLVKTLKGTYTDKITGKYVYYAVYSENGVSGYYRYTIKNGKRKKLSSNEYMNYIQ